MAILVKRKKTSIAPLSICNAKHQSSLVPLTAEMATTLPCPRGNAHSRRRDNVTTGQGPLFQMAKPPRKGVQKAASCRGAWRARRAGLRWQLCGREKRGSERELVPATPLRASCPLHRHLMMPCHITSVTTRQCLSSCTSRAKDSSPTPLKGHGHPAAIKGWSPEHTTSSAVWHGVGLLT